METVNDLYVLYFTSFTVVSTTTLPMITEVVNRTFKLASSKVKSIVSWLVPFVVLYAGWFLGNIFEGSFLNDMLWWHVFLFAAYASTMSNVGWKNIGWLKTLIVELFNQFSKQLDKTE